MYRDMLKEPEVSLGNDCKFTHTQTSHGCKHTLCIIVQFFIWPRVTKLRVCISTHRHGYKEHTYMLSFMLESVCCVARGHSSVQAPFPFSICVFSFPSSPSSVGQTRSSPCFMPLWSRLCCMNRAWPLFPRSWQNLKLSLEVFARQDLIKPERNLRGTF